MYHNNISENRSTRVAAPPGGVSSISFGSSSSASDSVTGGRGVRRVAQREDSGIFGGPTPAPAPRAAPTPAPAPATTEYKGGRGSYDRGYDREPAPTRGYEREPAPTRGGGGAAGGAGDRGDRGYEREPAPSRGYEREPAPLAAVPQARAAAGGERSSERRADTDIHSKPSTRVHHAPGGRSDMSSLISGGGGGAAPERTTGRGGAGARENAVPPTAAAPPRATGRAAVPRTAEPTAAPVGHTSVRVAQGPGGRSSGNILSWT